MPPENQTAGGLNDEFEAMLAGQTALGRVGEPQDVGSVVAGLLADENRWINGQSIEVSGDTSSSISDRCAKTRGRSPGPRHALGTHW